VLEADGPEGLILVKALVEQGANPNVPTLGTSAVHAAARMIQANHEEENTRIRETVAFLVEHGAMLDLFSAVALGDVNPVKGLLASDPQQANALDIDGYPALHFAVGMNYREIVAALLEAGCDVDLRSKSESTGHTGETALHAAAFWGRYEIAQALISAGADVNALTERKSTPLHDAARLGNLTLVQLLLENGAKPDARDREGKTPWDWSRELNWSNAAEVQKLLLKHQKGKER
jgi:ankyrin repeat protein